MRLSLLKPMRGYMFYKSTDMCISPGRRPRGKFRLVLFTMQVAGQRANVRPLDFWGTPYSGFEKVLEPLQTSYFFLFLCFFFRFFPGLVLIFIFFLIFLFHYANILFEYLNIFCIREHSLKQHPQVQIPIPRLQRWLTCNSPTSAHPLPHGLGPFPFFS